MGRELRLHGIAEESIVDGPGLRFAVFMQGCPHRCAGCHNPGTHDPLGGYAADTDSVLALFRENPLLSGMTLSGGEPFAQPEAARILAEGVKEAGKSLVLYTGYVCETLLRKAERSADVARLLELADLLVDGPYRQDMRDLTLQYRGSANQRVLTRQDIRAVAAACAGRDGAQAIECGKVPPRPCTGARCR